MADTNIPPEVQKLLPGLIGSMGALLWIKGTWPRRLALFVLGSAASFYGAPLAATKFGMGEGLAGFLVGLFGMSIVDSLFKAWQDHDIGGTLNEWFRKMLGLEPRPSQPPKEM
jgi:hypothetical protein